ncbi:MAG: hypothetical protein ABIR06_07350 [Cyclobacteriaceae bacterium]
MEQHYDDAKHHFLGDFPDVLPIEQAYVHIGMYLGWVIENDLYSEYFKEEASCQIFRFRRKEISCTILSEIWNGYLDLKFLNTAGNSFTYHYYGSGQYRNDYEEVLGKNLPSIYHVNDSWQNYDKIKTRINIRFNDWKNTSRQITPCRFFLF